MLSLLKLLVMILFIGVVDKGNTLIYLLSFNIFFIFNVVLNYEINDNNFVVDDYSVFDLFIFF